MFAKILRFSGTGISIKLFERGFLKKDVVFLFVCFFWLFSVRKKQCARLQETNMFIFLAIYRPTLHKVNCVNNMCNNICSNK